jgi:hypothetical protein
MNHFRLLYWPNAMVQVQKSSLHKTRQRLRHVRIKCRGTKLCMGRYSFSAGLKAAAAVFGESPSLVRYWKQKIIDENYHWQSYGGIRNALLLRHRQVFKEFIQFVSS